MIESKREEYIQRGLPHRYKDGSYCGCRECTEARNMGLGDRPTDKKPEMLYADPDWRNRQ